MLKDTAKIIVCLNLKKTCSGLNGNKCKMVNGKCVFQHITKKSNSALDDTQRTKTEPEQGNVTKKVVFIFNKYYKGEVRC